MGYWVLRTDDHLDQRAMVRAAQLLADRHEALRCEVADPLRYMSILYDAATVWTFYAPFLMKGPASSLLFLSLFVSPGSKLTNFRSQPHQMWRIQMHKVSSMKLTYF